MGVTGLWKLLRREGLIEDLSGEELAKYVEDKTIALDGSSWLLQASTEPSHQHDKRHVKVVFERLLHWLRMGAYPVVVLDGEAPPEKAEERRRRWEARCGRLISQQEWQTFLSKRSSRGRLGEMNADIKELLEAMGLEMIQAQGEAEAVCAKLNESRLVDAVASNDGDSLLLGARCVYRGLKLHTELKSTSHSVEICDMRKIEAKKLSKNAILALALLAGADFMCDGVKGVGGARAIEVIRILQRRLEDMGESHDSPRMLDLLREVLAAPVDEALIWAGGTCMTCRRCKHGDVRKPSHGPNGCQECKTQAVAKGGSGEGGCVLWRPEGGGGEGAGSGLRDDDGGCDEEESILCPCRICSRREERILHTLAKRATKDGKEEFLARFDQARKAYEDASRDMTSIAEVRTNNEGNPYRWSIRPAYDKLRRILMRLYGGGGKGRQNVARKMLPLYLEYDARHFARVMGEVQEHKKEELLAAAVDYHFLFMPLAIDGMSRVGGATDWRYVLTWAPTGPIARSIMREAAEEPTAAIAIGDDVDDSKDILPEFSDLLSAEKRAIRKTLIDREYPRLVEKYEARKQQQQSRPKKNKPAEKQKGAVAAARPPGRTLEHYFSRTGISTSSSGTKMGKEESKEDEGDAGSVSTASSQLSPSAVGAAANEGGEVPSPVDLPVILPPPMDESPPQEVMHPPPKTPAKVGGGGGQGGRRKEASMLPAAPRKGKRPPPRPRHEEDEEEEGEEERDERFGVKNLNPSFKRVRTRGRSSGSGVQFPLPSLGGLFGSAGLGGGGGNGSQAFGLFATAAMVNQPLPPRVGGRRGSATSVITIDSSAEEEGDDDAVRNRPNGDRDREDGYDNDTSQKASLIQLTDCVEAVAFLPALDSSPSKTQVSSIEVLDLYTP